MRVLTNYRADSNDTSEPLVLVALDGTDAHGINHHYAVLNRHLIPPMVFSTGVLPPSQYHAILRTATADLTIQTDAAKAVTDPNKAMTGMTDAMLLGIVLDHLHARQVSSLACAQQADAIVSIQNALASLQQRTV